MMDSDFWDQLLTGLTCGCCLILAGTGLRSNKTGYNVVVSLCLQSMGGNGRSMDTELVWWFQSLVPGTVFGWRSHVGEEQWNGYLDIHVKEIERTLCYNWAFTLGLPGDNDADFHAPYDLESSWSSEAVTAALNAFVTTNTGRTDVSFIYSPLSEEPDLIKKLRKQQHGIEARKLFDLGDGVHASDSVMDFLLEDPDRAAKLVEEIKKVARDLL